MGNISARPFPEEAVIREVADELTLRADEVGTQRESGEHVVGQWCSWTMMENWCFCMECTAQWKYEVQRTIKRAEPTAFTIKVHVDNKGITDGLWRGERKCIDPKAGDADLWIKLWEELQLFNVERKFSGSGAC